MGSLRSGVGVPLVLAVGTTRHRRSRGDGRPSAPGLRLP